MRKGFTLIELLAVIVILAIIALIATPIILGIINNAKEDSNKRSVENYAHAVELAVARYSSSHGGNLPKEGTYKIINAGKGLENLEDFNIDYKGEKIEGYVIITYGGKITLDVSLDGGKTTYNYTAEDGVTKNESSEGGDSYVSSPFKVSDSGVLMHYERVGNETSVVVPAEVNGIKIKSIAPYAFLPGDIMMVNDATAVMILNKDKLEVAKQLAEANNFPENKVGLIDDFGKGNDPFEILHVDVGSSLNTKLVILENNKVCLTKEQEECFDAYLENIDLSGAVYLEKISGSAFYGFDGYLKGSLKSVKFPMNGALKIIGKDAFADNQLTEIIIPSSVETIGSEAFSDNENLTKITIKRSNSDGMMLDNDWNGTAEVIYDSN